MPAKKKTSSQKKPAAKRTPPASSTKKRTTAKSSRGGSSQNNHLTAEAIRQKNQVRAVVLLPAPFAGLLGAHPRRQPVRWAHDTILGLFGSWALLWPVLMIYVAVITAMRSPRAPSAARCG
ncbi:MAG: hypothetical protein ACLU8J_00455 [Acutalibacter sp.]